MSILRLTLHRPREPAEIELQDALEIMYIYCQGAARAIFTTIDAQCPSPASAVAAVAATLESLLVNGMKTDAEGDKVKQNDR